MALTDLADHPRNEEIRQHPEPGTEKWEALKASLESDYFDPIVWNERNGQLVSGHLRKKVMQTDGMFTHAMVVVVEYDEPTHLARLLAANKGVGEDDAEGQVALLSELADIGDGLNTDLTTFTLGEITRLLTPLSADDEEETGGAVGDEYTTKISAPNYEPRDAAPEIGALVNTEKRDELQVLIAESGVPEEVKAFLDMGAQRHVIFDYGKIADYYAHAPKDVQELMEDSALVIIDFDKAIAQGYVRLTTAMKSIYEKNQGKLAEEGNYDAAE